MARPSECPRYVGVANRIEEWKTAMHVGAIMTREVHRADPGTPLSALGEILRANNIGALPVACENRLVGMVTDRDIVTRIIGKGLDPETATASDAMTETVHYAFDDEDAEDVAGNMRDLQVRRMPVVDHGKRLVGIVSLGDLANRLAPDVSGDILAGICEDLGG